MDNNLKVIDLACGIGGRSKAFAQAGFDVIYAIDNDSECERIYYEMMGKGNFTCGNLAEISPKELPNADIICKRQTGCTLTQ